MDQSVLPVDLLAEPAAAAPDAGHASLLIVPPPPDLAPIVEYVWQLELADTAPPGAFWRVVADGYVDLAMRLPLDAPAIRAVVERPCDGAARRDALDVLASSPAVVCGAATAARALPMGHPLLVTGARFRLGAAAGVLRNPPADLVDGARHLGDVVDGRAAGDVSRARVDGTMRFAAPAASPCAASGVTPGRVLRAAARENVIAALRRLVARGDARRRAAGPGPDPRVRGALHLFDRSVDAPNDNDGEPGAAQVARVCRELGVSRRTLERLFAEHVGFAPRTYQRLRRVGLVAERLERGAPPGMLSDLAHRLGFTDHAHMTREFGRVMGVAPSAYRREAAEAPVARRVGAVAFERTTPFGTVGRSAA